jgi:hypothetical protein
MNRIAMILAFAIAVALGAFLARLLERTRGEWSARRRLWVAASVLPAFLLLATVAGVLWVLFSGPGEGENMQDLAVAATAFVGALFSLIALIGGMVGARLARRSGQ